MGVSTDSQSLRARKILIVDDLADTAQSLAILCELQGAEAHVAHDGREAVRLAERIRPDIVLMDISMPQMNGYEAARAIRREPWGAKMILIALTGWGRALDLNTALEAGYDGHLVKPVDPQALFRTILALSK